MSLSPTALSASASLVILTTIGCGDSADGATGTSSTADGSTAATSTGGGDGGAGAATSSNGATGGGGGEGGSVSGLVPVFVAQGHMGRTSVSCDGGITYAIDQSEDDAFRCWSGDGTDCDHNPWAGRGLAYGNGAWVETFGWGAPGTLRRSTDLVTWQDVEVDTPTYADVAFGNGVFIANNSTTRISSDGVTCTDGGQVGLGINHRAIEFVPHGEGLFVITGESGETRDIVVSADGIAWTSATSRPPECGSYVLDIAYGDGTIALFSGHGTVCTSTDGGAGWTLTQVADGFSSPGLWTGSEFMVWHGATRYRSADGVQWTSEAVGPDGVHIGGPVARSDSGRFVAVQQSWGHYYEEQRFLWSDDGLVWTEATEYIGGHPINFLQFGHAEPSASCAVP